MKNGTKYRLPSHSNANSILKQLTYDLDLFIYKISVSYNKPIEFFNQWKCLVIDKFKIALKNNSSHIVSFNKNHLFKNIKSLQNNFIITYVDKAPNNYAIICKSYYHQLLDSVLSSDTNCKLSNDTINVKNKFMHIINYLKSLSQILTIHT